MPHRNSNSYKHRYTCIHACVCACVHAKWCVIKGSLVGETAKRLYNGCLLQESKENESEWALPRSAPLPVPRPLLPYFCIFSISASVSAGPLSQGSNSTSAFFLPPPLPLPLPQSGSNSKVSLMNLHFCPIARRQRCVVLFFYTLLAFPLSLPLLLLRCSCRSMLSQRQ